MYLEGLGYEAIGRVLGVSQVSVYRWIKAAGERLKDMLEPAELKEVVDMELDELWHFVGKKKTNAGSGWLLIELPHESLLGKKVHVVQKRQKSSGTRSNTSRPRTTTVTTGNPTLK